LCKLKIQAAIHLDFPMNGCFLGYGKLEEKKRNELYHTIILPQLAEDDVIFWNQNIRFIEKGIVSAGRFEQYIGKMRLVANLIIGKNNIQRLIACQSLEDQKKVFHDRIAPRKSLQLLFKIAFHPAIYKKRGLQEQALIHAGKTTGERFFSKFQNFCTSSLAAENYFLQYFLTGNCSREESFPEYLKPENRKRLINNLNRFELKTTSLQNAICEKEKGYYNKIHLSNMGDWLSGEQFSELLTLLKDNCSPGAKICYRYLQKNHFQEITTNEYSIDKTISGETEQLDRFPFYNILAVTLPKGVANEK
jgi:S-adenosylmethionine:diacylglycerol 3-amino-3-carboxypropyl transferase